MKQISPNIFLIQEKGSFGNIKPSENIYVLAGNDGLIFDAGFGNRRTIKNFIEQIKEIEMYCKNNGIEFNLTRIIPSHCHPDHFSGLKKIRRKLGIKIILTRQMADIIANKKSFMKSFNADGYSDYLIMKEGFKRRVRDFIEILFRRFFFKRIYGLSYIENPDEIIEDNAEIRINGESWRIFPSPGHAVDHISMYSEKGGILFTGDNILELITTWLGPPNCDINDYVNSIKYIQNLPNLNLILPAHGPIIKNPIERIEQILDHRELRMQEVIEIIESNSDMGVSPDDIINKLYSNGKRMLKKIARGWICLTLKMLEDQQVIKRVEGDKKIRFFPFNKV